YADTGIYTVELISSDIYGCIDTAERQVTIRLTPVVNFTFEEKCLGLPTAFAETTVMPGWAGIISRTWEFGDGTTSSSKTPTHIYALAGGYSVTLINRSINGCMDSTTKVVQVYPYPVAGFTAGIACEGSEVCFNDTSYVIGGTIAEWDWDFGNGHSDTVAAPCTEYADTGFYQVQLEVASDFGCSSVISKTIEVHPVPQSDFSLTPEYGIPPLEVQFYNYTQGAIGYNWAFGDGAYSSATNPQHTYYDESVYNIILVGTNEFGCTDTASANVYVIPSILDLVLTKLTVTDSSGFLYLKAQFFNNGTRNIRKIALDARVGNNLPIREEWSGLLEPGHYNNYNFTAAFLKPDISNIRLVCLDISTLDSYGQEDTEPENNASCHSLVEDFFIASVFPSPAADYVYADISVPEDGDVELSLVSRDGRELIREVIEDTEAGTLRIKMDLRFLADGMYILHAHFEDKTDMYRFVKTTE
ncbi:MAG TPA: PKD domain-containing protein, partial [Bacteroidales bacterium]|nr:PKD domain-containing protein [Bacteroidales bacterium]